jgi:hypothetical protein
MISENSSILKILFLAFVLMTSIVSICAQGCSDAGVCNVPSFRPGGGLQGSEAFNLQYTGLSFGRADHNISVFNLYTGQTFKLGERFSLDGKTGFMLATGNGYTTVGYNDIYLNLNYHPDQHWTFSGGIKFRSNKATEERDGKDLPMDYQTSLGTNDLLLGISYVIDNFQATLAYQDPLGKNRNTFSPDQWLPDTTFASFHPTIGYLRKPDVMLRISNAFPLSDKITFTPGVLGIYHIAEDEYQDPIEGLTPIIGSDGLTVNANLYFNYAFNERSSLNIITGFPFLVRDVRPDGLTRSVVFAVEYQRRTF